MCHNVRGVSIVNEHGEDAGSSFHICLSTTGFYCAKHCADLLRGHARSRLILSDGIYEYNCKKFENVSTCGDVSGTSIPADAVVHVTTDGPYAHSNFAFAKEEDIEQMEGIVLMFEEHGRPCSIHIPKSEVTYDSGTGFLSSNAATYPGDSGGAVFAKIPYEKNGKQYWRPMYIGPHCAGSPGSEGRALALLACRKCKGDALHRPEQVGQAFIAAGSMDSAAKVPMRGIGYASSNTHLQNVVASESRRLRDSALAGHLRQEHEELRKAQAAERAELRRRLQAVEKNILERSRDHEAFLRNRRTGEQDRRVVFDNVYTDNGSMFLADTHPLHILQELPTGSGKSVSACALRCIGIRSERAAKQHLAKLPDIVVDYQDEEGAVKSYRGLLNRLRKMVLTLTDRNIAEFNTLVEDWNAIQNDHKKAAAFFVKYAKFLRDSR